jgi:hypothetical protein
MSNAQDQIQARVDAFAAELTTLIRRAALEAVQTALVAAPAAKTAKPAAAPPVKSTPRPPSTGALPRPKAPPARARREALGKGKKRDTAELAKLGERLFDYIKAHPGERMEVIQAALGVPSKDLAFPVRKLRSANRIVSKGQKQSTTYSAR